MKEASGFDDGYRRRHSSAACTSLLGRGLPPGIEPFSFVPLEGLQLLATLAALGSGQTLVDLGCGRGGPGMWLAQRSGADIVGVDGSGVAVTDAYHRQTLFPGIGEAGFIVADVTATGLRDGCADATVAIDVLQLLDDQAALVAEMARLLKPGGHLLLTTWEGWGQAPSRFPRDLRAAIEQVGLRSVTVVEQPNWLRRQLDVYRSAAAIANDDAALADLAEEGRRWRSWHDQTRRVVGAAQRPGG